MAKYLTIGSQVVITFQADVNNTGITMLSAGFYPVSSQSAHRRVQPGRTGDIPYDPLPPAKQLFINVELPLLGKGILTVTQNGNVIDSEAINTDTIWTYLLSTKKTKFTAYVFASEKK